MSRRLRHLLCILAIVVLVSLAGCGDTFSGPADEFQDEGTNETEEGNSTNNDSDDTEESSPESDEENKSETDGSENTESTETESENGEETSDEVTEEDNEETEEQTSEPETKEEETEDETATETETETATETETQTETETETETQTEIETTYQVRIIYDGEWSGAVGSEGSTRSVDGEGQTTIDIDADDPFVISANAQKQDDSDRELTIQILENGQVVAEQSTTAEYGVASVSYTP